MMVRRTLEGAEKCALRDFLLEEDRAAHGKRQSRNLGRRDKKRSLQVLILVILSALGESGCLVERVAGRHENSSSLNSHSKISVCECG